jgi:hypothetical protein
VTPSTISSQRFLLHLTEGSSILFTTTTSCWIPRLLASYTCSRVWPSCWKPASNSPLRAEITSPPKSAIEAP